MNAAEMARINDQNTAAEIYANGTYAGSQDLGGGAKRSLYWYVDKTGTGHWYEIIHHPYKVQPPNPGYDEYPPYQYLSCGDELNDEQVGYHWNLGTYMESVLLPIVGRAGKWMSVDGRIHSGHYDPPDTWPATAF